MGYTEKERKEGKFLKLVEEAKGCAVLDSGCSTTVCGHEWYEQFVKDFSDFERSQMVIEESDTTFTFGDGISVPSLMRVSLPCVVGGCCVHIVIDVVKCRIPLLLSRKSMKRAKMIVNFRTDQIKIGEKK